VAEFVRAARPFVTGAGRAAVLQLNDFFFGRLGFHGNSEDYFDPRNSYLNDVIDRRTGIPITLCALYAEVGRRLGLPVCGVGFPGHFLAKCTTPRGEIIVDCFNARTLNRQDCQELLRSMFPGRPRLDDAMLEPASPQDIVSRMLNNLRRLHSSRRDFARTIRWIDLDLKLRPGEIENYRERGMIHVQMEQFGKALADLEHYLTACPHAPDVKPVEEQVHLLKKLLSHLN
jgi:regulator of sirC expression with transglutaminase-like and TPR domain